MLIPLKHTYQTLNNQERIAVYSMKPGDKYYDGPIKDDGRTLEEIEKD